MSQELLHPKFLVSHIFHTSFSLDVEDNVVVSEVQLTTMSSIKQAAALNQLPSAEASSKDILQPGESVWEIEMVMEQQQGSATAAYPPIPSEEESEEAEDQEQGRNGGEKEIKAVNVVSPLTDKLEKTDKDLVLRQSLCDSVQQVLSVPLPLQEQTKLSEPQAQQTVINCAIPEQRNKLDGSQVGGWKILSKYFFKDLLVFITVFFSLSYNPS